MNTELHKKNQTQFHVYACGIIECDKSFGFACIHRFETNNSFIVHPTTCSILFPFNSHRIC